MLLSPEQFRELQTALESGYSDKVDLSLLLRGHVGVELEKIANMEQSIRGIVYQIIQWAEKTDQVGQLLVAMLADRPTNRLIVEIVQKYQPPSPTPYRPEERLEDRYLADIIEQCDDFLWKRHPSRPLREVYVDPELTSGFNRPEDDDPRRRLGPATVAAEALLARSPRDRFQTTFIQFDALLKRLLDTSAPTRHVITGDPGIGKTTLLHFVALRCILEGKGMPVIVALTDYADKLRQHNMRLSLPEYLATLHANLTKHFPTLTEEVVKVQLETGGYLLLLDALDEIGSPQLRAKVLENIQGIYIYQPRLVVTSRSSSYSNELPRCTIHELLPLDDKQIAEFVAKYFGSADHPWVQQLLSEIRVNKRLLRMMSNPLLLELMISILRNKAAPKESRYTIPDRRAALYEEFFNEMIDRRFKAREEKPDLIPLLLEKETQKEYLYAIGHMLHKQQLWYALDQQVLAAMRLANHEAPDATLRNHLKFLVDEVHIIQEEKVRNTYSFYHLAFQEFATARCLIGQLDQDQVIEQLLQFSMDPWWHEVIVIYCSKEGSAEILQRLMDSGDNIFCTRTLLLADCVTVAGDDIFREALHERLVDLYRETPFTRLKNELFRAIVQLRADGLESFLAGELDHVDLARNLRAVKALGQRATPRAVEQLVGLLSNRRSLEQELIYAIIDALIAADPDEARRLVVDELYGYYPHDVVRRLTYITRAAARQLLLDLAQDSAIDSDLRDMILIQCGKIDDHSVVQLYRQRLAVLEEHRDHARLAALIEAVSFADGTEFTPLALTLLNGESEEVQAAARFLGRYKVKDTRDRLLDLLLICDDEQIQLTLVEALLQFDDPDMEEWVVTHLDDQPALHQRAIDALGRYGRAQGLELLARRSAMLGLTSLSPEVATALLVALAAISERCEQGLPPDLARRIAAYLHEARTIEAPELVPLLISARAELGQAHLAALVELAWFRAALLRYLLEQPIPTEIATLITPIVDRIIEGGADDPSLVLAALQLRLKLYGRQHDPQIAVLNNALRHPHESVCCAAVEVVRMATHLELDRFSPVIIELLAHPSPMVVAQAIETLGRLDDTGAVEPLLQLLNDPTFRESTYDALYELTRRNSLLGRDQLRAKRGTYDVPH